jgi:hypothetical protein
LTLPDGDRKAKLRDHHLDIDFTDADLAGERMAARIAALG